MAGVVALLAGLAMWAATFPVIRRKFFELFFYIHHLYIVFVVFYVLHVGFSYSCIMLPGLYLFLIDRYLRFLQSQQKIRLVSARVLPCEAVELNFSKNPGEDCHYINWEHSIQSSQLWAVELNCNSDTTAKIWLDRLDGAGIVFGLI